MAEDDKGTVPLSMVMEFAAKGISLIPDVSEQGEDGIKKMLKGALMLADDLNEDGVFDKAVDVDG